MMVDTVELSSSPTSMAAFEIFKLTAAARQHQQRILGDELAIHQNSAG